MSLIPPKTFTPLFTVGRCEPFNERLAAFFHENKSPSELELEAVAKESNVPLAEVKQFFEQFKLKEGSSRASKDPKAKQPHGEAKRPKFTVKTSYSPSNASSHKASRSDGHSSIEMASGHDKESKKVSKSITQIANPQLDSEKDIKHFLSTMDSTKSLESRINLVSILVNTEDSLLREFSANKLLRLISDWVHDCKDTYSEEPPQGVALIESLIILIISLCQRMPITETELKKTKIGRNINKFGKLCQGKLNASCLELVQKWKKMIDNSTNNKANDNNHSDEEYLKKKTRRDNNHNDHNYYSNDSSSQSVNKKAKHDENKREDSSRNSHKSAISSNKNYEAHNGLTTYHYSNSKQAITTTQTSQSSVNSQSVHQPNKAPLKKGGLKRGSAGKKKLHVRFEGEGQIERVRIFKMTDQPNAPEISDEEYEKIQQEVARNPHVFKVEEIRQREIKMDKPREPQAKWQRPKSKSRALIASIGLKLEAIDEEHGKNSKEKVEIEELCQRMLSVTYFNDIPEPKEGPKVLFSYEDEEIPKIENVKIDPPITTNPQEDSINDIMNYIETLQGKIMTQESFNEINNRLNNIKDISQEQKNNIKALLASKMPKIDRSSTVPLFNPPINSLPFNYANYSMGMAMPFPQPPMKSHPQTQPPIQSHPYGYMESTKRVPLEPLNSKMNLSKYKTKPCRNYHSSVGCNRDINCYFIHDTAYKGVDIPNFNYNNYEKKVCPALLPMESSEAMKPSMIPMGMNEREMDKQNDMGIGTQVPPGFPYVRPPMMPMNLMYINPYFRPMMMNPNQKEVRAQPLPMPMMKIDPSALSGSYPMGMPKGNQ